jgi:nucleotide-binding universal stress UspA family protein
MTAILVAVDAVDSAAPVLDTGRAVAKLLGASLRLIHVRETDDAAAAVASRLNGERLEVVAGDPATEIIRAVADPEVVLVVVGARGDPDDPRPAGHTALAIVGQADKPVLVVPPRKLTTEVPRIRRALVPLEGTAESTEAVTEALQMLADAGVDLVALHVFDADTVPRFWGEPGHTEQGFATTFLSRWCAAPSVDLHLRRGIAPATVMEVADTEGVDLIALGWAQDLSPGRARIVRAALAQASVPVLLVPLASGPLSEAGPDAESPS